MALPPISGRAPAPQPSGPQAVVDPRLAAQRAFFQAALDQTGAAGAVVKAPVIAAAPARAESRAVQSAATKLQDETVIPPHPGRVLRPGSLIDIKV